MHDTENIALLAYGLVFAVIIGAVIFGGMLDRAKPSQPPDDGDANRQDDK